jgi:hypothetical protein
MENMPESAAYSAKLTARSRDLDEAISAVRGVGREFGYQEIRSRLVAELRIRGAMLPPPLVDRAAKDVALGATPTGRIRRIASRAMNGYELISFGGRSVWALARNRRLPDWTAGGIRWIAPDVARQATVLTDTAGQDVLAVGAEDRIEVWFDKSAAEPGAEESLVVFRGEERVGELSAKDGDIYRSVIKDSYAAGLVPVITGVRIRQSGGSWTLLIGGPVAVE